MQNLIEIFHNVQEYGDFYQLVTNGRTRIEFIVQTQGTSN